MFGDLSVVVLSHGRIDALPRTLSHLAEEIEEDDVEVIIVDNSGDEKLDAILDRFEEAYPEWVIIRNRSNVGVSEGRNQGWVESTRPFILAMDDDITWSRDEVIAMLHLARSRPQVGIVSPVIVDAASGRILNPCTSRQGGKGLPSFYEGCFLLSRRAMNAVGVLDPTLTRAGEGLDYAIRLKKAGFAIVRACDARVAHYDRDREGSEKGIRRHEWMWSFALVYFKHLPGPLAAARTAWVWAAHVRRGTTRHGLAWVLDLTRAACAGARAGRESAGAPPPEGLGSRE